METVETMEDNDVMVVPENENKVVKKKKKLVAKQHGFIVKRNAKVVNKMTEEDILALRSSIRDSIRNHVELYVQLNRVHESQLVLLQPDVNIERGIFNFTVTVVKQANNPCSWKHYLFVKVYRQQAKTILNEFEINAALFFDRMIRGELYPHQVVFMRCTELRPDKWLPYVHDRQVQIAKSFEVDLSNVTDQYQCHRCHKRKCVYYERQTRSADEPMTVFVTCVVCNNHWTM